MGQVRDHESVSALEPRMKGCPDAHGERPRKQW